MDEREKVNLPACVKRTGKEKQKRNKNHINVFEKIANVTDCITEVWYNNSA